MATVSLDLVEMHDSHSLRGRSANPFSKRQGTSSFYDPDSLRRLTFAKAAPLWLETRKRVLDKKTLYQCERNIIHVSKIFEDLIIQNINLADLNRYQRMRADNHCRHGFPFGTECPHSCIGGLWTKKGGPSLINHELSVVQQILKHAGLWGKFADHYEPVPPPRFEPPKVLTELQLRKFFAIAATRPDWEFAGDIAMLTCHTTASGKELRSLQLKHVQLNAFPPRLVIPRGKNSYRIRTIALNDVAVAVFKKLIVRAERLGAYQEEDHLFPFRINRGGWDPARPASSSWLRRSWEDLREAAGLPWLTPHCMRHQAITMMAEYGIPPEVIRSTAGHVSEKMMRHYCHTRIETQHAYLGTLAGDAQSAVDRNVRRPTMPVLRPTPPAPSPSPVPMARAVQVPQAWGSTSHTW